jgi:Protein of unknown function (DUF2948)
VLKLKALDGDDLLVVSAQMQDALVRVSDMTFHVRRRQFAMIASRFAWEAHPAKERRRTGLHFENVLTVKRKGFTQARDDVILSLLAMSFVETESPGGTVDLTFSAGHSIQLGVEYLSCALQDLGPAWSSNTVPSHDD